MSKTNSVGMKRGQDLTVRDFSVLKPGMIFHFDWEEHAHIEELSALAGTYDIVSFKVLEVKDDELVVIPAYQDGMETGSKTTVKMPTGGPILVYNLNDFDLEPDDYFSGDDSDVGGPVEGETGDLEPPEDDHDVGGPVEGETGDLEPPEDDYDVGGPVEGETGDLEPPEDEEPTEEDDLEDKEPTEEDDLEDKEPTEEDDLEDKEPTEEDDLEDKEPTEEDDLEDQEPTEEDKPSVDPDGDEGDDQEPKEDLDDEEETPKVPEGGDDGETDPEVPGKEEPNEGGDEGCCKDPDLPELRCNPNDRDADYPSLSLNEMIIYLAKSKICISMENPIQMELTVGSGDDK